jgi:serine/threonine protein kinase
MLDIKPDNIMVDYQDIDKKMMIRNVQLTNLDTASYLPNGRHLNGMLIGNEDWRSPEASFKSKVGKPTDMYSFGLVVCSQSRHTHIFLNLEFSVSMPTSITSSSAKTPNSINRSKSVHCRI